MGSGSAIAIAILAESLFFGGVPDDILVNILCRLDEDPRDLARLACVSTRFCKLIKTVCWKFTCEKILPLLVAELLQSPSPALGPFPEPPGGWASLQKLLVCCPGLWHAGVLLENWDFGLDREIGWCGDFGYSEGFSYSDGSVALEGVFAEESKMYYSKSNRKTSLHRTLRLGAFSSTPSAIECSTSGSGTCMNVNNVKPHVSRDVCEPDFSNPSTHCTYAGTDSDGFEVGKADMDSHGKEVGMVKRECNKKVFVRDMDCDLNSIKNFGTEEGGHYDNDKETLDSINAEVGMGKYQHNMVGKKLGAKQCRVENSVSEAMKGVVEECTVKDRELHESAVGPLDDKGHGAMAIMKQEPVQMVKSTLAQPCPTSLDRDPLNVISVETSRASDPVGTHVKQRHKASSCITAQEKGMQDCRPNSRARQRRYHYEHCHVTTGPCNLSREQGNKLLANRFRADSLYICDWPGCLHPGDKRMYKLFRGVFKNFKHSHVWRNLKDMQAKATNVGCAFCICKSTWDMVTTFCLKRSIEYHDDGEPVVRAYVCENGHVAGAWTDRPMYIL